MKDEYHHGDLRRVLLEAAEAELVETGVEGFSLRKVAKRAGVSHAAPAHHFKDANGLLTALAEVGYRRFVEVQEARQAKAAPDARAQMLAQGLGYIDFALAHNALFRLMFSSNRPSFENEELAQAAEAAFRKLLDSITAIKGVHPFDDQEVMEVASATWAMAHGLADLISSGRMVSVSCLPEAERDAALSRMLSGTID